MQQALGGSGSLPASSGILRRQAEAVRQLHIPAPAPRPDVSAGSAAGAAVSSAPHAALLSAHPDAVRRRREAEQRRDETREQMEIARQASWYQGPAPSNFMHVDSREAFAEAINAERLTVVDFFVPWCVACRRFHPALVKLAAKHPDCTFLAVNGSDPSLHDFVASLGVERLPYFQVFHAGKLLRQFAANLSKIQYLRSQIAQCKEQLVAGAIHIRQQGDSILQNGQELASMGMEAARQASGELLR
ncbi:hypothetical protein CVIRNUC_002243 [Coccomyxa viridis]|uniref:Thioredoxin domain-containing protein n=1 Tax=Coccomyxa viridis TaxID=1274662 RepID=A0AAV1HVC5_9CHLO|nr:hypothetical protein CVIRNUC_002243 [Coccomyxa viridis]